MERLLDVVNEERLRLGLWIGARAAVVVDRSRACLLARGAGASAVIDPRGSRSAPGELRGARLTLLGPGDRWRRRERIVELAGGAPLSPARDAGILEHSVDRAFDPQYLLDALASLPSPPPAAVVVRDAERVVRLELDVETRLRVDASGRALAWADLVATFTWPVRRP